VKIPVGPAWSSFAVAGNFLFTQEHAVRGDGVCYDANTGREVWKAADRNAVDDPLGGPGPRATPTIANGGLFVTGATGMFLRLDPATGAILWQQDLKSVAGRAVPMGVSRRRRSSPAPSPSFTLESGDKGLLAFDVGSELSAGLPRWQ